MEETKKLQKAEKESVKTDLKKDFNEWFSKLEIKIK